MYCKRIGETQKKVQLGSSNGAEQGLSKQVGCQKLNHFIQAGY